MKKILQYILIIAVALIVYSMLSLAGLYMESPKEIVTNDSALHKINNVHGDYFEFIAFSDNHAGLFFADSAALRIVKYINREDRFKKAPIDFVMIAGDVTFRGTERDYSIFNKIRNRMKYPVLAAFGNHDDDNGGGPRFNKYIGKREYSFADRNSYFIVLDNASGEMSDKQLAWFESELKKSGSYAHRFVIAHKPPLSPFQQSWYRPENNPWSRPFIKFCTEYKVDMVISGHEHMSKELNIGGVKYVTVGGGGMLPEFTEAEGGFLHYIVVRVYGDHVDYEIRKVFPPLWEYFGYYIWKELVYFVYRDIF